MTDTTKNQGLEWVAAASSTGFYLSANTGFGATDVFLGSRAVGELGSGGTATATVFLQIPAGTAPGSYYVIARADWNSIITETAETNNDRASGQIKFGGDLVVTAVSASGTGAQNGPISVTDTTKNQGVVSIPESATGFYLSLNSSVQLDRCVPRQPCRGPLGPSETGTASTQLVIPPGTAAGTYYVIGMEILTGESPRALNPTTPAAPMRCGWDRCAVTALSAPSSVVAGTSISASATTKNQGGDTRWHRSQASSCHLILRST